MKYFRIYQTIKLVHYIDAPDEDAAREELRESLPLSPPKKWDTEIDAATVDAVEEYDPEG